MLAAAQGFAEFAAEAQRIEAALRAQQAIIAGRMAALRALDHSRDGLYQAQHTGYQDGQPSGDKDRPLYYE
jgi:hypothetical protein